MFCNKCIVDQSAQACHSIECPMANLVSSPILTSTIRMAFRTLFVALSLFNGSVDELEKFLNENSAPRTIFDNIEVNEMKRSPSSLKSKLLAIHFLVSDYDIEVNEKAFEEVFLGSPSLKSMWTSNTSFIKSFLKRQVQIGTLNYHEIYVWPLKRGGFVDDDDNEIKASLAYKRAVVSSGNGSYPFHSLFNHSCSQNVNRIFVDSKLILVVSRPISKSEQIFDNYGYSFTNIPKEYRQFELLKQYRFECSCKACSCDWPLLPGLKVLDKAILNRAKKTCRDLNLAASLNQKKAYERYKEICGVIQSGQFHSLEICSLMESAAALLELSLKPVIQFA